MTYRWLSKDPIGISGGLNQYVAFENNPIIYRDPFGEIAWIGAAIGSVSGFAADIALQSVVNMAQGEGAFSEISWKSAGLSAVVGGATGATGIGAVTQGKRGLKAVRTAIQMRRNLRARKIAMAAGKFRNPAKTAFQVATERAALKEAALAAALGSTGPVTKQLIRGATSSIIRDESSIPEHDIAFPFGVDTPDLSNEK